MIISQNEKHDFFVNQLGVKMKNHYDILDFHIHTLNNLQFFIENFYTGHIEKDVQAYRVYKKQQNQICKEDYSAIVKKDKKKALEALFQEPLSNEKLKLIDEYQINLDKLYDLAKEHIGHTFVSLINNMKLLQDQDKLNDNYYFLIESC